MESDLAEGRQSISQPAVLERAPLAVDLDGTLTLSDTLHENLIELVKVNPRAIFGTARALLRGKASFKQHVASATALSPDRLPYNGPLLDYLRVEKQTGRRIGLFTAADQSIADAVADHLGVFDVAHGSQALTNRSGDAKADLIEATFGPAFAYAGNADVDLPIFARAESVILVGPTERLRALLEPGTAVEASFPFPQPGLGLWLKAFRLHHWIKNSLVFVAAFLSSFGILQWLQSATLFLLLGVIASATYVLNDLLDLQSDRAHPRKRFRPFAAGLLPVKQGLLIACAMIAGALLASLALPVSCTVVLLAYLTLTICYSLILKRLPMVDVTALAALFTLRVLAGSLLENAVISPWLLTFSMLFFLGLALIKRYAELLRVVKASLHGTARGYDKDDIPLLMACGVAAGFSAIVIFMIYMITDQYPRSIYRFPGALWGIMPVLLLWTMRLWHYAVRGKMNEDPVLFAIKDRTSLALAGVVAVILLVARVG